MLYAYTNPHHLLLVYHTNKTKSMIINTKKIATKSELLIAINFYFLKFNFLISSL